MNIVALIHKKRIDDAPFHRAHSMPSRVTPPTVTHSAPAEEKPVMATTAVAIPTPVSPTPGAVAPHAGGFKNFMDHIGHAFKTVFSLITSPRGQKTIAAVEGAADIVVGAAAPGALPALMGIQGLFNAGLTQAVQVETVAVAAGQSQGTGLQKAAAVTTALTPQISDFLKSIGVSAPTAAQIQNIGNAVSTAAVGIMNAIPAPATPAQ